MWKVIAEHRDNQEEIRKIWKQIPAETSEEAIDNARMIDGFLGGKIYWPPETNWTAEEEK